MTEGNVKNTSDYRKKDNAADANGSAVSSKNLPVRLSEKLRDTVPSELGT